MKMVRISDALADRLDAVRDRIAQENSVMSVTREQAAGMLIEEGIKAREDDEPKAAEG